MNFIVREGDVLCTPALTHVHTVESIGSKVVVLRFKEELHEFDRNRIYDALSEGSLMILKRA